jgi:hypothetical protein
MTGPRTKLFWPMAILVFLFSSPVFSASDEDCLACHGDQGLKSEKGQSVFVDKEKFSSSVHGQAGISCLECHSDLKTVKDFPHPAPLSTVDCSGCHGDSFKQLAGSVHDPALNKGRAIIVSCKDCHGTHSIRAKDDIESTVFPLNLPQTCEHCHLEKVITARGVEFIRQYEKSIHFQALQKSGLTVSADCGDCHGAHAIRKVNDTTSQVSRKNIIRTCGRCHVGVEKNYLDGVHGKDYTKGIKDVPVCTDCHNEHEILSHQDAGSRIYATRVASVCSRCHDDERLGRQYGFLTSRLKTYSSSFHGTASKFGEIRVANCASCHGFHDIRNSTDPKSSINAQNLPRTCGQCHTGAGLNFAKGKVHVLSEKTTNKWAYLVKIFYIVMIAGIISVFIIFIAADLFARLRHAWKK